MYMQHTKLILGFLLCFCAGYFINYNKIFTQNSNVSIAENSIVIEEALYDIQQIVDFHEVLEAICQVESNCDSNAIGDNGDSIGPFQIQYAYWFDAVEFSEDPYLTSGSYEDCFNHQYAYSIVFAYMERYAMDAMYPVNAEKIARIHNGGPKGYTKQSTIKYWNKVKSVLNNN